MIAVRRLAPEGAVCLVLLAAVVLQDPGRLIRDSKLQAALDPGGLMATGLHLWDPSAGFGQVPNQAAGYLFPMGPFFWVGQFVGLPPWLVQRAWIGALLVAAFAGTVLLARELSIGSRLSRAIGGLAYALAPAVLSLIGFQSAAMTGFALLPFALWPLVRGSRVGSPRRAAAASVVVVVAMGGANAASILAALVLPTLWLVCCSPGARRRALAVWWAGGVVLATLWWTGPLVLQGRYGLDFAAITESSGLTTANTSMAEILRGSGAWTSYLVVGGRVWVPAGWSVATDTIAVIGGSLVVALGLFGLARRDLPTRAPFVLSFLVGSAVMVLGWPGPIGSPLAEEFRGLLDGPAAPLRNIHKFAPLVGLPLALGVTHTIHLALARVPDTSGRIARPLVAAAAAAVLAAAALPLSTGQLPLDGAFDGIPDHWTEAAAWIDAQEEGGRTLLLPAASFGQYEWGRPFDEPFGSLSNRPWAVRSLVPLGGDGTTRLLDGIEDVLVDGRPSDGLAPTLARAGVRYVLARHDLDPSLVTSPEPAVVHHVLTESPGLRRVAWFGAPTVPALPPTRRIAGMVDSRPLAPIEIFEVAGTEPVATTYPVDGRIETTGGPEYATQLATTGFLEGRAAVAEDDLPGGLGAAGVWRILTDGAPRRDLTFGRVHDQVSFVLTSDQRAPDGERPVQERRRADERVAAAVPLGGVDVIASSYADGDLRRPETLPYAAIDGDLTTRWRIARTQPAVGQWVELRFEERRDIDDLAILLPPVRNGRSRITGLSVSTEAGTIETDVSGPGDRRLIDAPEGETNHLRLTIDAVAGGAATVESAGIAEIDMDDFEPGRTLLLPQLEDASAVVLTRFRADPFDLSREDEETVLDRTFDLGPGTARVEGTATARPSPGLLSELAERRVDDTLDVVATSTWGDIPEWGPWNAADGNPRTVWVSDPANPSPTLTLTWDDPVTVDGVALVSSPGPFRPLTSIGLEIDGVIRPLALDAQGRARFPQAVTDELTIRFPGNGPVDPSMVVGVAELEVRGLEGRSTGMLATGEHLDDACGTDLSIEIDGDAVPVTLDGTLGDLASLTPIAFRGCSPLSLETGEHRLTADGSSLAAVDGAVIEIGNRTASSAPPRTVEVRSWEATERSVGLGEGTTSFLAIGEGFNRGWEATADGEPLEPVQLDGWRQGFVVPAGDATVVDLRYAPDRPYRLFLLAGALAAVVALLVASVRFRDRSPAATCGPAAVRSPGRCLVLAGTVVLTATVGGVLVLVLIPLWFLPARPRSLPGVAAAAYAAVCLLVAPQAGPGGAAFDAGPQILAVLAFAAVALSLADELSPAAIGRTEDLDGGATPVPPD